MFLFFLQLFQMNSYQWYLRLSPCQLAFWSSRFKYCCFDTVVILLLVNVNYSSLATSYLKSEELPLISNFLLVALCFYVYNIELNALHFPELFLILNFQQFFFCGQRNWLEVTKRNAVDISDFRNQFHHKMLFGELILQ